MEQVVKLKGAWNLGPAPKLFKSFQENNVLNYIYPLIKFSGLMSCGSKDIFKNVSCTDTHHDITDLVKHPMVKNTKT